MGGNALDTHRQHHTAVYLMQPRHQKGLQLAAGHVPLVEPVERQLPLTALTPNSGYPERPYRDRTNNRERTELENPDFGRIFELRSARTELLSKSELTSGHSTEW